MIQGNSVHQLEDYRYLMHAILEKKLYLML